MEECSLFRGVVNVLGNLERAMPVLHLLIKYRCAIFIACGVPVYD